MYFIESVKEFLQLLAGAVLVFFYLLAHVLFFFTPFAVAGVVDMMTCDPLHPGLIVLIVLGTTYVMFVIADLFEK